MRPKDIIKQHDQLNLVLKFGIEESRIIILRGKHIDDDPCKILYETTLDMLSDLYGDDMNVRIMDDVKYFICGIADNNKPTMKLLTSFHNIKTDSAVLEIIIWSNSQRSVRGVHVMGHNFVRKSTRQIKLCSQCKRHIWGLGNHAYCTLCGTHIHRKCTFDIHIMCPRANEINPSDNRESQLEGDNPLLLNNSGTSASLSQNQSLKTAGRRSTINLTRTPRYPTVNKASTLGRKFMRKSDWSNTLIQSRWTRDVSTKNENHLGENGLCPHAGNLSLLLSGEDQIGSRDLNPLIKVRDVKLVNNKWTGTCTNVVNDCYVIYKFVYDAENGILKVAIGEENVIQVSMDQFSKQMSSDSACIDGEAGSSTSLSSCAPNEDLKQVISTIASCMSHLTQQAANDAESLKRHMNRSSTAENVVSTNGMPDVAQFYEVNLNYLLGMGRFAKVYGGTSRATGEAVAIKVIKNGRQSETSEKSKIGKEEVQILKSLCYPAIVKCLDVFESSSFITIVTEKLDIDLFEFIVSAEVPTPGQLSESHAKFICFQIVCALKYLHEMKVGHFDLKPENVLLRRLPAKPHLQQVKLADFGYASIRGGGDARRRHSLIGTTAYLAPEIQNSELRVRQGYNFLADIWAFGVVTYVILCGYFPYRDDMDILKQMKHGRALFTQPIWRSISTDAKDLITYYLLVDTSLRLRADEVIYQDWFVTDEQLSKRIASLEEGVGEEYLSDHLPIQSKSRESYIV